MEILSRGRSYGFHLTTLSLAVCTRPYYKIISFINNSSIEASFLSTLGAVPEVTVTYLRAPACAGDTTLVLEEAVDWHPGDEAVIMSAMSVEGTGSMEEVVVVETVHNAELHLRTPLRYSNCSGGR